MTSDINAAIPEEQPQADGTTLHEDMARTLEGKAPATGPDGRPVEQKWATGGGRIVALIAGIAGVLASPFVAMIAVALGFLALVLGSTARGHMQPGRPGRGVATAAFVLGVAAIVLGAVSWVVGMFLLVE